ncbi:hypothetical protein [Streptomyces coerulescens]|uniref:Uncharacterized protein n=1 Tax=Streptomyces coerulescens TaxID=29304 RepID=A0ABW0CDK0_STRCD
MDFKLHSSGVSIYVERLSASDVELTSYEAQDSPWHAEASREIFLSRPSHTLGSRGLRMLVRLASGVTCSRLEVPFGGLAFVVDGVPRRAPPRVSTAP